MTASTRSLRRPAPLRHDAWPTTLRFSRRLGESVRDAEYASAIEGPDGRPPARLEPIEGLVHRMALLLASLLRR